MSENIELRVNRLIDTIHGRKQTYLNDVNTDIKISGLCFDVYEDRDVGRSLFCTKHLGHKGHHKHLNDPITWGGKHPFTESSFV